MMSIDDAGDANNKKTFAHYFSKSKHKTALVDALTTSRCIARQGSQDEQDGKAKMGKRAKPRRARG